MTNPIEKPAAVQSSAGLLLAGKVDTRKAIGA